MAAFFIDYLPDHVHQVAQCGAWLNRYWAEQSAHYPSEETLKSDLEKRIQILSAHTKRIPITFIALDKPSSSTSNELLGLVSLVRYRRSVNLKVGASDKPALDGTAVWLTNLYVKEEHRSGGIGRALIARATEHFKSSRMPCHLKLFCHHQKTYYEQLGWRELQQKSIANKRGSEMIYDFG